MPLTKKGSKILSNMDEEYGEKKGKSVFYASVNKGTVKGAEKRKKKSPGASAIDFMSNMKRK